MAAWGHTCLPPGLAIGVIKAEYSPRGQALGGGACWQHGRRQETANVTPPAGCALQHPVSPRKLPLFKLRRRLED